jgi:hypothetical protein
MINPARASYAVFMLMILTINGEAAAHREDVESIKADVTLAELSRRLVDAAAGLDLCTTSNAKTEPRRSGSQYVAELSAVQDAHYFFLAVSYLKHHASVNANYDNYWEQLCATDTAFHNLMYSYQGVDELLNSCLERYDDVALSKDAIFMYFRQKGYERCFHYGKLLTPQNLPN